MAQHSTESMTLIQIATDTGFYYGVIDAWLQKPMEEANLIAGNALCYEYGRFM